MCEAMLSLYIAVVVYCTCRIYLFSQKITEIHYRSPLDECKREETNRIFYGG